MVLEKKRILSLSLNLTFFTFIARGLAIPSGIFCAKIIGVSGFASLAVIQLITKYLGYFDFGALKALNRNATIAKRKDNSYDHAKIKKIILSVLILTTVVPVIIFSFAYFFGLNFNKQINTEIFFIIIFTFFTNKFISYLKTSLKTDGEFEIFVNADIIGKILAPLLTIPLVIYLKLSGILLSVLIVNIIKIFYLLKSYKHFIFSTTYEIKSYLNQMKTGIYLYFNGLNESILISSGIIISSYYFNKVDAGIFAYAASIAISNKVPFNAIINIYLRRMTLLKGGDDYIKKILKKPLSQYLVLNSLVIGYIIIIFLNVVQYILLEFSESADTMIILYFGYNVFLSQNIHKNFIDLKGKFLYLFFSSMMSILLILLLCTMSYFSSNLNLEFLPYICISGFILNGIINHYLCHKMIGFSIKKSIFKSIKIISVLTLSWILLYSTSSHNFFEISTESSIGNYLIIFFNCSLQLLVFTIFNLINFKFFYSSQRIFIDLYQTIKGKSLINQ